MSSIQWTKGTEMKIWKPICLVLMLAFVLGGCTAATVVGGKIAAVAVKPIFGLAVKDAETTLAWVDRELEAGRLPAVDEEFARRCPEAVLALDALRARLEGAEEDVEGFKGLIYFGTLNRFGRSPQEEAATHFQRLAGACFPLIPAEKLIRIF